MSEIIDAEVVEKIQQIVSLEQKPVLAYSLIAAKGLEVRHQINGLNLHKIEASEENLSLLKSTRAKLSKDFKDFEEQRKLIKDLIMKPYNDFEIEYKKNIAEIYNSTDLLLKEKTTTVEMKILDLKIEGLKNHFKIINCFSFVTFEDMNLSITRSKTNKSIIDAMEDYIMQVQKDLQTIETLQNKDRILAKYQISKDFNKSISETNIEIDREKQILEQKNAKEAELLKQEQQKETETKEVQEPIIKEVAREIVQEKEYKASFEVVGTIEQIKLLKNFMNQNNIKFGSIK